MKEFRMHPLEVDGKGTAWYLFEGTESWIDGLEDDSYDGEYGLSKDCTQMFNRKGDTLINGGIVNSGEIQALKSCGRGVTDIIEEAPLYYIFDELPKISNIVRGIITNINPAEHNRWLVTMEHNYVSSFTDTKTNITGNLDSTDLVIGGVFVERRVYGYFDNMTLTFDEKELVNTALRKYKLDSVKYRKRASQRELEMLYCTK